MQGVNSRFTFLRRTTLVAHACFEIEFFESWRQIIHCMFDNSDKIWYCRESEGEKVIQSIQPALAYENPSWLQSSEWLPDNGTQSSGP